MAWQEAIEIAKCEDGWKEEKCDKKTVGKHYKMTYNSVLSRLYILFFQG